MAKTTGYRSMINHVRRLSGTRRDAVVKVLTHLWEIDRLVFNLLLWSAVGAIILSAITGFLAGTDGLFVLGASTVLMYGLGVVVVSYAASVLILWFFLFGESCQEERHELRMLIQSNQEAAYAYEWLKQFHLSLGWTIGKTFNVTGDPDLSG